MSTTTAATDDATETPGECTLCGLATGDDPLTDEGVPGGYCCRGCLEVARTLDDVESADPEAVAEELDGGPADAPEDADSTFLAVEGMHCATCETFIESVAADAEGVYCAEASYATDMVRVAHEEAADLDALDETLDRYGYAVGDPAEDASDDGGADAQVVRFLIGGGMFGMMVMLWYALFLYPTYLGFEPLVDLGGFDGLYLFGNVWLMTSIVLFYTGYPILRGAVVSLRAGQPNMDLLVSLAAASSYLYSTLAVVMGRTHVYFDVTVAIVLVVTLGNYYEDRIKRKAASGLSELTAARVGEATRVTDGGDETVPVADLAPGDRVVVRPGERVPVDGEVAEGVAAVDESLVTGESVPETRRPGDRVLGGTVVTDDPLVVEVGEDADSTLDRLVGLLWEVQSSRSGVQRLADKLAVLFVPTVLALSVVATGWHLLGGASVADALLAGLTVLIVSCPCALGLATPLAVASGVRDAADSGVVVTSDAVFEAAPEADVVVLDKTGTLTDGEMTVREVVADDPETVLSRAAAVERFSAHPIAEAVADAVEDPTAVAAESLEDPTTAAAESVETHDRGVTGTVAGEEVVVGHPDLLESRGLALAEDHRAAVADAREAGRVPVAVGWAGRSRGVVAVGDAPRSEWENAVAELAADREVVVLTGDDERAAATFRANPNVSEVFAGVPPEAKAETVERLKARGTVAMVGDGSNDAPALAAADIGIALASGTDLAGDAADAILVEASLDAVPEVFAVARGTNRRIRHNLGWAFLYNVVAIPLAALGLLNPLFAAVAMGASSLVVVTNSSRSVK